MGEQITERGVGNGISLIIFASIVAQAPAAARDWYQAVTSGNIEPVPAMILIVAFLAVIATICFFEQAQRRIPIQYARRLTGKSVAAGQTSHLPSEGERLWRYSTNLRFFTVDATCYGLKLGNQ